jgi:F-type H+-transporting ATPase subunit alpha
MKAMKQVAERCDHLAQYRELAAYQPVRVRSRRGHAEAARSGQRMTELLKQPQFRPLSVASRSPCLRGHQRFIDGIPPRR